VFGSAPPAIARPVACSLALCCGLGLPAISQPLHAQARAEETVYVDLGRWTIYERAQPQDCVLRHSAANGMILAMAKRRTGPAVLTLETPTSSIFVGDIVFAFDEAEFPGRLLSETTYAALGDKDQIAAGFRKARLLSVRQGGATIATLSLKTSAAGYRLLKQCAEKGFLGSRAQDTAPASRSAQAPARGAPSAPLPPPARPSQASPDRTTRNPADTATASLARAPRPRDPSGWLRNVDFGRAVTPSWSGGVLAFTLTVNRRGRVEECIVNSSSGSREFDALACRNLRRRARFDPALDNRGNPTEGRYNSSIRFALTE